MGSAVDRHRAGEQRWTLDDGDDRRHVVARVPIIGRGAAVAVQVSVACAGVAASTVAVTRSSAVLPTAKSSAVALTLPVAPGVGLATVHPGLAEARTNVAPGGSVAAMLACSASFGPAFSSEKIHVWGCPASAGARVAVPVRARSASSAKRKFGPKIPWDRPASMLR